MDVHMYLQCMNEWKNEFIFIVYSWQRVICICVVGTNHVVCSVYGTYTWKKIVLGS